MMAIAKDQGASQEPGVFAPKEDGPVAKEDISFAKALKQLEETVKALESGELSLEDSLAKFEEGIALARRLESVLDRAEQKVKEILNPDDSNEDAGPEV